MKRRVFIRSTSIALLVLLAFILELPSTVYRWIRTNRDPLIAKLVPAAFGSSVVHMLATRAKKIFPGNTVSHDEKALREELQSNNVKKSVELGQWIIPEMEARLWSRLYK